MKKPCKICDGFTEVQRDLLATPTYRIRKDKKAGILVFPKEVTVIRSVDSEPTFQSPSGDLSQVPAQQSPAVASSSQQASYVTSEQLSAMSDKWAEQFAHMEALLTRGNIFSTPVSAVKPMDTQPLICTTPFVPPATRPTDPVGAPVAVEDSRIKKSEEKKKKAHKSRKHDKPVQESSSASKAEQKDAKVEKIRDRSASTVRKPASSKKDTHSTKAAHSSGPESVKQPVSTKESSSLFATDPVAVHASAGSGASSNFHQTAHTQSSTGACAFPLDTNIQYYSQLSEDEPLDRSEKVSGSDNGFLSETPETPEQTEEMSYWETVRSVRSFMGWHHVPTFETTYSEPDKFNNPWKGKNPRKPTRVSVAMPPDDWLCQKLERLNLTALEGYPSRSQDSAGLKRDQFIKVPKSQSKWYAMHLVKPDGPHRPGRSVFSWRNEEVKVNPQFPRLTKASAYPFTGPPSRRITLLIMWKDLADVLLSFRTK